MICIYKYIQSTTAATQYSYQAVGNPSYSTTNKYVGNDDEARIAKPTAFPPSRPPTLIYKYITIMVHAEPARRVFAHKQYHGDGHGRTNPDPTNTVLTVTLNKSERST